MAFQLAWGALNSKYLFCDLTISLKLILVFFVLPLNCNIEQCQAYDKEKYGSHMKVPR